MDRKEQYLWWRVTKITGEDRRKTTHLVMLLYTSSYKSSFIVDTEIWLCFILTIKIEEQQPPLPLWTSLSLNSTDYVLQ